MPDKNIRTNFDHAYALIIGVGYDLPVTAKDAVALAGVLSEKDIAGYKPENVWLLTEKEATADTVRQAFESLIQRSSENASASVLIYFSGHGDKYRDRISGEEDYYLKLYGYDDYDRHNTMLNGTEFAAYIHRFKADKLMVFLDCCHADAMNNDSDFLQLPSPRALIGTLRQGKGRVYMSSCDDHEKSLILDGEENSLFTTCLLEAIKGHNSGGDDYVHALHVLSHIMAEVQQKLKSYDSLSQHPIISELKDMDPNFFVCNNSNARGSKGFMSRLLGWFQKEVSKMDTQKLDEQLDFLMNDCTVQEFLPNTLRDQAYRK